MEAQSDRAWTAIMGSAPSYQGQKSAPRSALRMDVFKAENGWVIACGSLMWIAADASKLAALLDVLAEEFQEKEMTL